MIRSVLSCLFCLLLVSLVTPASSESGAELDDELESINRQIENLSEQRARTQTAIDNLVEQIRGYDKRIADIGVRIREIENDVAAVEGRLEKLSSQDKQIVQNIRDHQEALADHVRLAWVNAIDRRQFELQPGRRHTIALLTWIEALAAQRQEILTDLKRENADLESLRTQQRAALERLADANQQAVEEDKALRSEIDNRKGVLQQLQQEIDQTRGEISGLESKKQEIEAILQRLAAARDDTAFAENEVEFASLKGKLPWPHDGTKRERSDAGVLISAKSGDPVTAIAPGRIAFAEWLRGFGMLIIIDHGDGYMSLYGHNQSLFRKVGDWVSAGDTIATAGQSGGQPNTAVYFEIREDGDPLKVQDWCS